MTPEGLEDHHPTGYHQNSLEKQDLFGIVKAQILRADCGQNHESWQEDQGPLDSVNKASWPGGDIVQTVYQVAGGLHRTIS